MKRNLSLSKSIAFSVALMMLLCQLSFSQTVTIDAFSTQSGNIVIGLSNNHVSEHIYTEAEIGAANFTTAATAIDHIDLSVFAVGTLTIVNNFKIYLKEVPLSSTTLATGAYDTTGYTLVFDGTVNFDNKGWKGIDLTTPFIRTSGNNLQMLMERTDGLGHGPFSFHSARGNQTGSAVLSSRRENPSTAPIPGTTVLIQSNFRPRIQFRHIFTNDARLPQVYTLGKLPIPFAAPHVVSAKVVNHGSGAITNLAVTLNVTGANTFNDVKTIPSLPAGDTTTVYFAAFTPTNTGSNVVTVTLPVDDFTGDNSFSVQQEITNNAYNYASGTVATGSTGFAPITTNPAGTGDFAAAFTTITPTSVNQVGVSFALGGQPFKLVIWDKSGNGKPGTVLWESTPQTSTAGVFTLPISPAIPVTDTFYVGIRQTGTTNIQFAYQSENPVRPNTFFNTFPSGNNSWIDVAPSNPFRFMIEPRLTLANDVGISEISDPVAASNIDYCGLIPQATVSNFGSSNQTVPFSVTFLIRQAGAIVYSDTKSIALNSSSSQKIYFAPFTGTVTATDTSIVYTSLAADAATNNDTVVNRFNTGVYSYTDSLPNSGGYSYANSTICAVPSPNRPTYNWVTQTTSEVNWGTNGDDSVLATPVPIPFSFKYFGNTYSQFWLASNGWISFTNPGAIAAATQRTPVAIPLAGGLTNYIAAVLANLDVTTSVYPDAHTYYGGDAMQMVITFLHAHLFGSSTDYISFQIILKVNGDILVQYNDTESTIPVPTDITNFCSVGIENSDGSKGLQYRLNASGGAMFGSPLAVLFIAPQVALPVSLTGFSAQRNGNINKISWITSQEINTRNFEIERSADGHNFSPIGRVPANGNSNTVLSYSFTDNAPVKGINYYRLSILDAAGTIKYSAVKSVRNNGTADISIYPIPVKDVLTLMINSDAADKGSISVINLNGQLMQYQHMTLNKGQNKILLNAGKLSAGAYILKIKLQGDLLVRKFNKQ